MRTAPITQISFTMENLEEIFFPIESIHCFNLDEKGNTYLKLEGQEVAVFKSVASAGFHILAKENHTYNSFGRASEISNFNRILDGEDITVIELHYGEASEKFYVAEDYVVGAEIDEIGDLYISIHPNTCCCEENC